MKLLLCFALFAFSSVVGESCTNPRVKAVAYTNSDAQVLTQIAFVAEFELECANGVTGVSLHADVEGAIVPAIRVKDDANNKYQVSWTKDLRHAKTGDYEVNLYDDDGYAALKRDSEASVKPLVTIVVNFPGAYKGAWVNSELMAAGLAAAVFYLAYSSKAALLA